MLLSASSECLKLYRLFLVHPFLRETVTGASGKPTVLLLLAAPSVSQISFQRT